MGDMIELQGGPDHLHRLAFVTEQRITWAIEADDGWGGGVYERTDEMTDDGCRVYRWKESRR